VFSISQPETAGSQWILVDYSTSQQVNLARGVVLLLVNLRLLEVIQWNGLLWTIEPVNN